MKYPVSKPSLTDVEREALLKVIDSGQLTHGPTVVEFEKAFAAYIGVRHAIACSSGTTALHLITASLLQPGDEVLVPDVSFVATANAVRYTDAEPVLCDVDRKTWTLSVSDALKKISNKTRAILGVHLYGEYARDICEFAASYGLDFIEDAAEGLGGVTPDGKKFGSLGKAAAFSFFGNKVMTTGEGGMVTTDDDELAARIRHLRGQAHTAVRYFHNMVGFNYRMTEMQAALGLAQLSRLPELLMKRRAVMMQYHERLSERYECSSLQAAPWQFTFLANSDRDWVQRQLASAGIDTRPVFVPMHDLPMYGRPSFQFPVSLELGRRGLSLPTYPDLSLSDVDYIADHVLRVA